MKNTYEKPELKLVKFNVEESIMSIQPRLGGGNFGDVESMGIDPDTEE